ncbi:hypothetical protein C7974DRAFT_404480 [Boeremia exigua]|uniref:uncharacterized protein n=1 Tax=Boeremia exigua TaxID=749465 RepID=UPI001E8DC4F0|nr:uncharacterized protein C7974DRAFT_404480 [Boeremia exigua]KAH6614083.1 hypothetical protein C7974DRAFT_404480 [Boeremia exigua]
MVVPSFARATRSSGLKISPVDEKTRHVTTPVNAQSSKPSSQSPKRSQKLKRPSTLTRRARESIAYNADLYHIKPSNPSKPCLLATLPSELRTLIYTFVLGDLQRPILMNYGRIRHSPSTLLHICRAVRIEAAYIYFAEASFTWIVKNLNFAMIMRWLQSLQPSHRSLLSRNPNLTIEIIPGLSKSFTYPPKGFLLDDTMENHWKVCQPFGNLYTVKSTRTSNARGPLALFNDIDHDPTHDSAKVFFILFCRLAGWSRLRTQPSYANIRWKYEFDLPSDAHGRFSIYQSFWTHRTEIQLFMVRLKKLWTRNQCEDRIRPPILELLDTFLEAFAKLEGPDGVSFREQPLFASLEANRERVEKWTGQCRK